jgi:hypothetical protein
VWQSLSGSHLRDALKAGESQERLDLVGAFIGAWRLLDPTMAAVTINAWIRLIVWLCILPTVARNH